MKLVCDEKEREAAQMGSGHEDLSSLHTSAGSMGLRAMLVMSCKDQT